MTQLALALPCRTSHDGVDFLIASPNCAAVAFIDRWPDWPGHALALVGPAGAGKTHLAAIWRERSGAVRLAADALGGAPAAVGRGGAAFLVEDVDAALADGTLAEADLLHLYNWLREQGGWLLLSGRRAPAQWPVRLPDLRSRLAALPTARIGPPDDDLLAALLVKQLADRQLQVAPRVIEYVLARIERSFSAIEALVAALDRASLERRQAISLALARRVMHEMETGRR
ncbi:MAG: hypothetical protein ACE5ED_06665 [Rhodothalassiaceae bacterium]